MSNLRIVRLIAWIGVVVAGFFTLATGTGWLVTDGPLAPSREATNRGGSFAMVDHRGRPFTDADLRGKHAMLFFGFTSCPDVCPTTLAEIGDWLAELESDGDRIAPVFVSVDPERDDVAQMASYLSPFDGRIVGLTGTSAQLAAFADAFGVYYKKVPTGDTYTMDHTASVLLLDRAVRPVNTIDFHEDQSMALAKIRHLLTR